MSLSYLEREFVNRIRRRRSARLNWYLGLMSKKTNKLAADVREVTLSSQFAPSALLVLSAMVVGFWLVHFVKISIS